jgi:hypothetical protein
MPSGSSSKQLEARRQLEEAAKIGGQSKRFLEVATSYKKLLDGR